VGLLGDDFVVFQQVEIFCNWVHYEGVGAINSLFTLRLLCI
jgi:hypothetical protein